MLLEILSQPSGQYFHGATAWVLGIAAVAGAVAGAVYLVKFIIAAKNKQV